tara:strand:+ start:244 stop:603 length:360 start_codon:yes stop_codon:yes gene_type:complete
MKQYYKKLHLSSDGSKIENITHRIKDIVFKSEIKNGIVNVSILNTTASLIIQENADPDVLKDLQTFYRKLVPMNGDYVHSSEGVDDMPAHIKSTLTNSNLTLSVLEGVVQLGIWQDISL